MKSTFQNKKSGGVVGGVLTALLLVGCNGGRNSPNIEVISNMMDQIAIKAQDWNPKEGDKLQMRQPPAGAIPRGKPPYKYADDVAGAEKDVNPLANDHSTETMALGQKKFAIYCSACHGTTGEGNGLVAEKMAVKPRNLVSPDALTYPDGRIFYAMTMGRGVMGSFASQIPNPRDRWAIVNYVRSLQKQKR